MHLGLVYGMFSYACACARVYTCVGGVEGGECERARERESERERENEREGEREKERERERERETERKRERERARERDRQRVSEREIAREHFTHTAQGGAWIQIITNIGILHEIYWSHSTRRL